MGDYDISPSVDAREEFSTLSRPRPGNSVFPLLDSKSLAHDVHLSVETVDAPAAAIAAAVAKSGGRGRGGAGRAGDQQRAGASLGRRSA